MLIFLLLLFVAMRLAEFASAVLLVLWLASVEPVGSQTVWVWLGPLLAALAVRYVVGIFAESASS